MPDDKKLYLLSEAEINDLVARCAKTGIEAYQRTEQDHIRREERTEYRSKKIKMKLESYRRVKRTIAEEKEYTPQEQHEYRLKFLEDLMGDPLRRSVGETEGILLDQEKKRQEDQFALGQIDRAMGLYQQECEESGKEEDIRRCRELRKLYLDDNPTTVEQIASLENVSVKTVYRDINMACEIMYQYIVGM